MAYKQLFYHILYTVHVFKVLIREMLILEPDANSLPKFVTTFMNIFSISFKLRDKSTAQDLPENNFID
jgi:hypothetical protein